MNPDTLKKHFELRLATAQVFVREPHKFKVCEQCRSVNPRKAPFCRFCGAYRWEAAPEEVIHGAVQLALNVFPVTSGVVPRL